jgi:hypothetical protein
MEVLAKIVGELLAQTNSPIITILLLVVVALVWRNHLDRKDHRHDLQKQADKLERLQQLLSDKGAEERKALLDLVEKYHQGQISITQAINDVRNVLNTVVVFGRGGNQQ